MAEKVFMKAPCGWCITNSHAECLPVLEWAGKEYICGCNVCDNFSKHGSEPVKLNDDAEPETEGDDNASSEDND
jgi:hypothetical protein